MFVCIFRALAEGETRQWPRRYVISVYWSLWQVLQPAEVLPVQSATLTYFPCTALRNFDTLPVTLCNLKREQAEHSRGAAETGKCAASERHGTSRGERT